MKGVVFIALNDFVEQRFGIASWESILEAVKPDSRGIYTSVQNYDDAEMLALVHTMCHQLQLTRAHALRTFGEYLFGTLNTRYPLFSHLEPSLFGFLASVERIVHTEVKKLYPDATLPLLRPINQSDTMIELRYESERKMCELAEGLIQGAADHYGVAIKISQSRCYHLGDDHCQIKVEQV